MEEAEEVGWLAQVLEEEKTRRGLLLQQQKRQEDCLRAFDCLARRRKKVEKCSMPRDWTSNKRAPRLLHYIPPLLYVRTRNPNHPLLQCELYVFILSGRNNRKSHTLTIPPRHYSRSFGFQFKYLIVWHFPFFFLPDTLTINAFLLRPSCLSPLFGCTDPRLFCVFVCV